MSARQVGVHAADAAFSPPDADHAWETCALSPGGAVVTFCRTCFRLKRADGTDTPCRLVGLRPPYVPQAPRSPLAAGTRFLHRAVQDGEGRVVEIEVQTEPGGTWQDYRWRLLGQEQWIESMAAPHLLAVWYAQAQQDEPVLQRPTVPK